MSSLSSFRIGLGILVVLMMGSFLWLGSNCPETREISECESLPKPTNKEDNSPLTNDTSRTSLLESPLPSVAPLESSQKKPTPTVSPIRSQRAPDATNNSNWPHYDLNRATPCVYIHFLAMDFALQDSWITDHLFGKIECGVRFLIEPFASQVTEVPSIYIWMGGISTIRKIVDSGKVDEMRKRGVKRVGIHHMFDEGCETGDEILALYPKFDFVLREFECQNEVKQALEMKIPFVMTPLGQMNCFGTPLRNSITRSSLRSMLVFFAGQPQEVDSPGPRHHMIQLKKKWEETLSPHTQKHILIKFSAKFTEPVEKMTRTQYRLLIRDSVFCLLGGRGGHWETWRMFEALASGCIPIIDYGPGACGLIMDEKNQDNTNCGSHLNYPEGGDIPWFVLKRDRGTKQGDYEGDVSAIINKYRDPVVLDELQSRLYLWWRGYVEHFTTQIRDAVVGDMDLNSITTEQSDMISGGYSHMLDLKPNEVFQPKASPSSNSAS